MRRILIAVALVAVPLAPASALPPDCERYGDKPCILVCEQLGEDWYRPVQMLVENAPPKPFC